MQSDRRLCVRRTIDAVSRRRQLFRSEYANPSVGQGLRCPFKACGPCSYCFFFFFFFFFYCSFFVFVLPNSTFSIPQNALLVVEWKISDVYFTGTLQLDRNWPEYSPVAVDQHIGALHKSCRPTISTEKLNN